ncbi:MAG: hypothetical protein ACJ8CR_28090 [Roseiflexaceae bacterium]
MIHTAFGRQTRLWALGALIPAVMVPLMIYHTDLDAWQEPIAFIYLHLVLLVLFPALLLPIALLNRDSRGALAWATGVALILYTAFYAAYDALAGLRVGLIYEKAKLTGNPTITTFVQTNLGDDAIDLVQFVGTLGWTAALALTIIHWWRSGSRSPLLGLLGVSAIALWWNHPGLPGVITYGSLALATVLLPLFGRSARQLRPQPASEPHG